MLMLLSSPPGNERFSALTYVSLTDARFTNVRDPISKICDSDVASRVKQIWGLDEEGEINGAWRNTGVEGFYVMMGTPPISCAVSHWARILTTWWRHR